MAAKKKLSLCTDCGDEISCIPAEGSTQCCDCYDLDRAQEAGLLLRELEQRFGLKGQLGKLWAVVGYWNVYVPDTEIADPVLAPGETVTATRNGRLCVCGCGQPVPGHRSDARYATGACRVRAHRAAR